MAPRQRTWRWAVAPLALGLMVPLAGGGSADTGSAAPVRPLAAVPAAAASAVVPTGEWGVGQAVPQYTSLTMWLSPQPDDEGGLWAQQLNTDSSSFPVFVYLTNGENTVYCTNDAPLRTSPAGNLGTEDRPPFNDAGDIAGAPAGYLGGGLPPEAHGAQGDNPPVFPLDPTIGASGWGALQSQNSYTGSGSNGTSYTEGFNGSCRASRLAAMTTALSDENQVVAGLSAKGRRSWFPAVRAGQAPDGQVCFPTPMNESYVSADGRYATLSSGTWTSSTTPAGNQSAKDSCAYDWITPTGDIFVFNLGDLAGGFRSACPYDYAGDLKSGPAWPAGTNGYLSAGTFAAGARPDSSTTCASAPALTYGQEAYGVTPSDVVWAVQQVVASGLLPAGLNVGALDSTGWLDGYNQAGGVPPSAAGVDVLSNQSTTKCSYTVTGSGWCQPAIPPPGACSHYSSAAHAAVDLALSRNVVIAGAADGTAVCAGNPRAGPLVGTTDPGDGQRFWRRVFNYDTSGRGWEAAGRAYAWVLGLGAQDPYSNVDDTCPGSAAVRTGGQSQWSCQESPAGNAAAGSAPAVPGDSVRGMTNVFTDPTTGEGFTDPL